MQATLPLWRLESSPRTDLHRLQLLPTLRPIKWNRPFLIC
jgi:hypothetical protein